MARLIDADKLIEDIENSWDWLTVNGITASTVLRQTITDIQNMPTVDAVPIIRCRECRFWGKQDHSLQGRCNLFKIYPTGSWYCANAKKGDR